MITSNIKLGILAGGGDLPAQLVAACRAAGRPFHLVTFKDQPMPTVPGLQPGEHTIVNLGAVGATLNVLREEAVRDVVLIGAIAKPSIFDLRPDIAGMKLLASVALHHDDALLSTICRFLESEGFRVMGVHDVLPGLMAPKGSLGVVRPVRNDLADIEVGWRTAKLLGQADVGQAVIVKDKVVIGVEAVEGTDLLLERCAGFRGDRTGGVLVKVVKPGQDLRVDLPSIGPRTLELLAKHSYRGVAVEAGRTLVIDQPKVIDMANANGLFVVGEADEPRP
jgi:DUF1009 family protein